jgi:hypothetical protein
LNAILAAVDTPLAPRSFDLFGSSLHAGKMGISPLRERARKIAFGRDRFASARGSAGAIHATFSTRSAKHARGTSAAVGARHDIPSHPS